MKLKTEQEIKQQADKEAEEYHPLIRDIDPDKYFVITQSFYEGASWLQQDLLASASESFEDFCESNTSRYFGLGTFQRELDEKLWQAAKLSDAKEIATLKGVLDSYGNMEVKLDLLSDENEKLQKENKEIETLKRDLKYLLKGTEYFRPDMKDACEEIRKRHNLNKDT